MLVFFFPLSFLRASSWKPEMPKEGHVGEITKTTRRQAYDGQTRGPSGVGAGGGQRPPSVCGARPAGPAESAAFDQRVSSGRPDVALRAAQPDGRVAERRRRRAGRVDQQELVGAASDQVHADAAQDQVRRVAGGT